MVNSMGGLQETATSLHKQVQEVENICVEDVVHEELDAMCRQCCTVK